MYPYSRGYRDGVQGNHALPEYYNPEEKRDYEEGYEHGVEDLDNYNYDQERGS